MLATFRKMSWQVTVVLGLTVLAISLQLSRMGDLIERRSAIARDAGQPGAVTLADFDAGRDMMSSGEVHLLVRLDPRQMLTVTGARPGPGAGNEPLVQRLFLLQDPADKAGARVRGAILLEDADVGRFLGMVGDTHTKENRRGQVVTLNGIATTTAALAGAAMQQIDALGLRPADEFLFVSPFLYGREAVFPPRDRSWRIFVGVVAGFGGMLLVLAIGKRMQIIKAAMATNR